jgi:hypothetical protein
MVAVNPLRWNARQGLAASCGAALVVALLAFPPWRVTRHHMQNVNTGGIWHFAGHAGSTTAFAGYSPLFRPPHSTWEVEEPDQATPLFGPRRYQALGFDSVYTIEWSLLVLELVVVCFASTAGIYELRGRRVREVDPRPGSREDEQGERRTNG